MLKTNRNKWPLQYTVFHCIPKFCQKYIYFKFYCKIFIKLKRAEKLKDTTSATVITPFCYQSGRYSGLSEISGLYHSGSDNKSMLLFILKLADMVIHPSKTSCQKGLKILIISARYCGQKCEILVKQIEVSACRSLTQGALLLSEKSPYPCNFHRFHK